MAYKRDHVLLSSLLRTHTHINDNSPRIWNVRDSDTPGSQIDTTPDLECQGLQHTWLIIIAVSTPYVCELERCQCEERLAGVVWLMGRKYGCQPGPMMA